MRGLVKTFWIMLIVALLIFLFSCNKSILPNRYDATAHVHGNNLINSDIEIYLSDSIVVINHNVFEVQSVKHSRNISVYHLNDMSLIHNRYNGIVKIINIEGMTTCTIVNLK